MDIQHIFSKVNDQFILTPHDQSELSKRSKERKFKRRQYLLQEGDTCNHFSLVVKGCFKMYALDGSGTENIISFFEENDWIADLKSFYQEEPTTLFVEAIEPALVIQLARQDVYYMYRNSIDFNIMIRFMIENKFIELQNRVLQNISSSAEQRYLDFLKQYPRLSTRIPNTYIASYLGITPEFLSKIRKKLSKNLKQG